MPIVWLLPFALVLVQAMPAGPPHWPRWRGLNGSAVADGWPLPTRWGTTTNVRWKTAVSGEGSSSPIVWGDRLFVTAAFDHGARRCVYCFDANTGQLQWTRSIEDKNPERSSALTGHAAATPATDGTNVVACFGNAGVVCYDFAGQQLWHRHLGEFDSELGLASSPMLFRDTVILVCDHDGDRFTSFDSYLTALDLKTGTPLWRTERPGLQRSWSTPILAPGKEGLVELIVSAQEQVRGYDPATGKELWRLAATTGWVTPSPVFGHGLLFVTSGKNGPTLALRPGGRGDVAASHLAWKHDRGGPYVCSPLLSGDNLYVHNEQGALTCYKAKTGVEHYRQRIEGKFTSSPVAGDGKVFCTNEEGTTYVLKAGPVFELLAKNSLGEYTLASPALAGGRLYIRTERNLFCIEGQAK